MIAMIMHDYFNYYCHLFWLLVVVVDAGIINKIIDNKDMKSALVFFQWSAGFERNFQSIRCATDQSSEDPFNRLAEVYPEMQGLYRKLIREHI
jgi:hypothetical protein